METNQANNADLRETHAEALARAEIDRSVRLPVLFFFTNGLLWLLGSSLLAFVASMKLHNPDFLGDAAWLAYGRIHPASSNAFLYGWVFQAGLGAALWIMARLCRAPLTGIGVLLTAGHIWNIAVTIGVAAILLGEGTSFPWLDFPSFLWPVLLLTYAIMAGHLLVLFRARRSEEVFISQYYLLASALWFPWVYLTANLLLHVFPGAGVMGAAVNAWYVGSVLLLWAAPVGLGTAYYLIPKIVGKPIYSYQLALGGFWMLAILGGWSGAQSLKGGPLPAWIPAVSGTATIFLLIPMIAVAINFHRTMKGSHRLVNYSPTLRFAAFGAVAFNLLIVSSALLCLFSLGRVTQFTHVESGVHFIGLYSFFTMILFGAIYFIVPRLVQCEWRSGGWIRFHFWFSAYGSTAVVAMLILAGISQGIDQAKPYEGFRGSVEVSAAYLVGRSLGWVFIFLSNLMFFFHILLMVFRLGRRSGQATMLHDMEKELSAHGVNA